MNDEFKRLKPLKIIINNQNLKLNEALDLEDMLKKHPNLSSLLEFNFVFTKLKNENDGTNLVEKIMKAHRIDPKSHPIMHEYFLTEEFHKNWMY